MCRVNTSLIHYKGKYGLMPMEYGIPASTAKRKLYSRTNAVTRNTDAENYHRVLNQTSFRLLCAHDAKTGLIIAQCPIHFLLLNQNV